jgi:hypothetical protein
MARSGRRKAIVGVSDHGGWAVLMTVRPGGPVVDRRRILLVDEGLPALPHHHDAQKLPVDEGVALVEQVAASAARCARAALDALAADVKVAIGGIALRACPPLPPTIAERISSYRAMCVADWVMYRQALATAAEARGWRVSWYDAKRVEREAATVLGAPNLRVVMVATELALGRPWQKDHRLAMCAAIAAGAKPIGPSTPARASRRTR